LLAEIGIAPTDRPAVRALLAEEDPDIVVAACKLLTVSAEPTDRCMSAQRLLAMLPVAGWHLQDDIEVCLTALAPECWPLFEDALTRHLAQPQEQGVRDGALHTLLRVKRRLEANEYEQ
jgi:hypothetical protein